MSAEEVAARVIRAGRAYVRIVEATTVLLDGGVFWTERLLLRFVRALYRRRLRQLVGCLPPAMTAEIMAAGEAFEGQLVQDFSAN